MTISLTFDDGVRATLQAAPAIMLEELSRGLVEASLLLEREVKERTPAVHGTLRDSIGALPLELSGTTLSAGVGSASPYAAPVELGTRPHMPPLAPLIDWVRRVIKEADKTGLKGQPRDDAEARAETIARKIQWKIYHHGTEAVGMFGRTLTERAGAVEAILLQAVARAMARINGGAS